MSAAVARLSRLGAVCLAAAPVVLAALPSEPFGWFAYAPMVGSLVSLVAQEVLVWTDVLLAAALALVMLWAPARTRAPRSPPRCGRCSGFVWASSTKAPGAGSRSRRWCPTATCSTSGS
ncbi:hypothetical protein [Nonomuraea sp. NPDC050691]|uniref:hypothetical protein n=1 Tax=Nonomuraea sp. NPDC050691 TaxID=3155661 RepID=UPI0033C05D6C